jgi:uncharacterized protein (DUF488 family)
MKKFYTIGYGGLKPEEFLAKLTEHGIVSIADVRLRPDRSHMGSYVRAKSSDKGIEHLLATKNIAYYSFLELGNVFMECDDWHQRYHDLLDKAGDLLLKRLINIPRPFCLLCAEKSHSECHRQLIADQLVRRGWLVKHIQA